MILGLLVMITSVSSITAVVAEFVFVLAGHIGVLEVTVVFLLVGRRRIFAIRNNSGHNGTQNQNLKTFSLKVNSSKHITKAIQLKFKMEWNLNKNKKFSTHHKRSLHVGGCKVRLRISSTTAPASYIPPTVVKQAVDIIPVTCVLLLCTYVFVVSFWGQSCCRWGPRSWANHLKKFLFFSIGTTHTHTHTHTEQSLCYFQTDVFL